MVYDNKKYIMSELSELKAASIKDKEIIQQVLASLAHLSLVCSDYESELLSRNEELERLQKLLHGNQKRKKLRLKNIIYISPAEKSGDNISDNDEDLLGGA